MSTQAQEHLKINKSMDDYYVILSVTYQGETLNHRPLAQYRRIRHAISDTPLDGVTLTMPRMDRQGNISDSAPIEMNLDTYMNGYGFSNADIRRWLEFKGWTATGTLLLFQVDFRHNVLNYTFIGKVDKYTSAHQKEKSK